MRARISIRGLFIITALIAVICYWRDRPRRIANQFIAAVKTQDRETLDYLVADAKHYERMLSLLDNDATDASAQRDDRSFSDWTRGECRVMFVVDGPGNLSNFHGVGVASSREVTLQNVTESGAFGFTSNSRASADRARIGG